VKSNGKNLLHGLFSTLLSGYDLPYRIFNLYRLEAFSKIKFYRNRNIFLPILWLFYCSKRLTLWNLSLSLFIIKAWEINYWKSVTKYQTLPYEYAFTRHVNTLRKKNWKKHRFTWKDKKNFLLFFIFSHCN
jgi:hypothetical protein